MTAIVSATEAAVRNGDTVFIATAAATPGLLVQALFARARTLHDVTLLHFIPDGLMPADEPDFKSPFVHRTLFVGHEMRRQLQRGSRVRYYRCRSRKCLGWCGPADWRLRVDYAAVAGRLLGALHVDARYVEPVASK
jgi:hypothetical protein